MKIYPSDEFKSLVIKLWAAKLVGCFPSLNCILLGDVLLKMPFAVGEKILHLVKVSHLQKI